MAVGAAAAFGSWAAGTSAPQDLHATAAPTGAVPAGQQQVAATWDAWKARQRLTGPDARPDYANPAQMNHFTWYQSHDWSKPYPGEDTILAPDDVPGAYLPGADTD